MDVPCQGGIVGQDNIVTELAIMGDMYISHDPVIIANARNVGVLGSAQIKGDKFANSIAIADFQPGWFAGIFFVLRGSTQRAELENLVVPPYRGMPLDNDMWTDLGTGGDTYMRTNHRISANLDR